MSPFAEQLAEQVGLLTSRHCEGRTPEEQHKNHFKGRLGVTTLKTLMRGGRIRPRYLKAFARALPLEGPEEAELRIVWGERLLEAKTYEATDRDRFLHDNRTSTEDDEQRRESYGLRKGFFYKNFAAVCGSRGGGLIKNSPKHDLAEWFRVVRAGKSINQVASECKIPESTLRSFRDTGKLRPGEFMGFCQAMGLRGSDAHHPRALFVQVALDCEVLDLRWSELVKLDIAQHPRLFDWLITGSRNLFPLDV